MSRIAEFIRRPPFAERLGIVLLVLVFACIGLGLAGQTWATALLAIGYHLVVLVLGVVALVFLGRWVLSGDRDTPRR